MFIEGRVFKDCVSELLLDPSELDLEVEMRGGSSWPDIWSCSESLDAMADGSLASSDDIDDAIEHR
jgi:hypothetical protein